jgi:hypothetical protein
MSGACKKFACTWRLEARAIDTTCTWRLPLRTLMFVASMFVEEDHASSRQPVNRAQHPRISRIGNY